MHKTVGSSRVVLLWPEYDCRLHPLDAFSGRKMSPGYVDAMGKRGELGLNESRNRNDEGPKTNKIAEIGEIFLNSD